MPDRRVVDDIATRLTRRFGRVYRGPELELEGYLRGVVEAAFAARAQSGALPPADRVAMRQSAARLRRLATLLDHHGAALADAISIELEWF